jgi:hypothetical protein
VPASWVDPDPTEEVKKMEAFTNELTELRASKRKLEAQRERIKVRLLNLLIV